MHTKLKTRDLIFIQLIIIFTIVAWKGILRQTPEGEAFIYYSPEYWFINPNGQIRLLFNIDNFTRLFFYIFDHFFSYHMFPYMLGIFMLIITINISLYLFVKSVTKNSLIAYLSTLYAGINYKANYQFYSRGHIHWFLQRVPELIPLLASLSLLIYYLKSNNLKHYLFSLLLFFLALLSAYYTTMVTPFIPIYLFIYAFFSSKSKSKFIKIISLSLPYLFTNYLVLQNNSLGDSVINSGHSFTYFFQNTQEIINKIFFQLAAITIPLVFIKKLNSHVHNLTEAVQFFIIPTLAFYGLIFVRLIKTKSKHLPFALAIFCTLITTLFLNLYLGRVANIYNEIEQSRYYYLPAIYVGIILAIFIQSLLHKKTALFVVVMLTALWGYLNIKPIWKINHDSQYQYTRNQKMLNYLGQLGPNLPADSYVFVPNPPGPSSLEFLGNHFGATFLFYDVNWALKLPPNVDPQKVFVFNFKSDTKKSTEIIDQSEPARQLLSK